MKKLSKFDLGMIIAFAIIGLIGGGVWYWLSSQTSAAQDAVRAAKNKYDSLSTSGGIVVSPSNEKTLQANIDLLKAQIDPVMDTKLNSKSSKLASIDKEDSVAWKHDLDDRIRDLNKQAKSQGIKLPGANYYFAFGHYTNGNPDDDKTLVLSKQLLAVEQLATILIKAPVKSITSIRRTYEEDASQAQAASRNGNGPRGGNGNANNIYVFGAGTELDHLTGFSFKAPGDAYTVYPFEFEFDVTVDGLRKVMSGLTDTPYIFVVRSISIANEQVNSPQTDQLQSLAGTPSQTIESVADSAPGGVAAAAPPAKGPQYLFGNSLLHVKTRIDLIEWNGGN